MAEDSYIQNLEKVSVTIDGETFDIVAASFRGVPFFVDDYTHEGLGRTIVTKKIPFSDRFVNEDNGANVPSHELNIYLVGDDCDIQKQNLVKACGTEGAAEFVHPWLGRFNARVSFLKFSSRRSDLGYIKGRIVIAQEDDVPSKTIDTSLALKTKVDAEAFRKTTMDKFVESFAKLTKKGFSDIVNATNGFLDIVVESRKSLNVVNEFVNEVGAIKANIEVLVATPRDLSARITNLITTSATIFGIDVDKKDEALEYISILSFNDDGEMGRLVKNTAASCLLTSLVDADFSSIDEASEFQKMVNDAFEKLLNATDDVEDFVSFSSLQASALSFLRDSMANMAVVIEKPVKSTTNILTLCFDTYNDISRIDEVMKRNGFSQGLFITPCNVKVLNK